MTTGSVIVLGEGAGLGGALVRRFRAAGHACVAVARNGLPGRMAPGRERE